MPSVARHLEMAGSVASSGGASSQRKSSGGAEGQARGTPVSEADQAVQQAARRSSSGAAEMAAQVQAMHGGRSAARQGLGASGGQLGSSSAGSAPIIGVPADALATVLRGIAQQQDEMRSLRRALRRIEASVRQREEEEDELER